MVVMVGATVAMEARTGAMVMAMVAAMAKGMVPKALVPWANPYIGSIVVLIGLETFTWSLITLLALLACSMRMQMYLSTLSVSWRSVPVIDHRSFVGGSWLILLDHWPHGNVWASWS